MRAFLKKKELYADLADLNIRKSKGREVLNSARHTPKNTTPRTEEWLSTVLDCKEQESMVQFLYGLTLSLLRICMMRQTILACR
jgi:hypothetical protein